MISLLVQNPFTVLDYWETFIFTGKLGPSCVRSPIQKSWQRCYSYGVDPYATKLPHTLKAKKLKEVLHEKEGLINVAKPFMAKLYKFIQGSGFVVVLTNEKGYIMEMFGDKDSKNSPFTKNFFVGASWSEDEVGTNAIGTAIITKEPVQVSGAEHYLQKYHRLTCSAAPIFNTDGSLLGIIDISGSSYSSHFHTLGIVVAAAEAIMAQLRIQQKNNELALINNRMTNIFNTMSDGVLLLDNNEMVIDVNPAARTLLGKDQDNIIGTPVRKLFDFRSSSVGHKVAINRRFNDVEIIVETKEGLCSCLASGDLIFNEQENITGSLIIIQPIKKVHNLVNRFSGHNATLQFSDIIGESSEISEAVRLAKLIAPGSSNILLQGESGTGKEIFAQAIHNGSMQKNGPFVPINCGAIPRELIGSELFGYEEGAFTGAKKGGKLGKFELANGGTLFLDEIGEMPMEQQTALLRVIQEKKVARIGSNNLTPVNVRLICASNKDLLQEVEKGRFRKDLFYRLNVISLIIPPLRNRVDDIPLLFDHFLQKFTSVWGNSLRVDQEVMECIKKYHWPGNVRELQNVVERAANLTEKGIITVRNLPAELLDASNHVSDDHINKIIPTQNLDCREQRQQRVRELEKSKIIDLLNKHGGNVSRVAKEMGLARKTIYNKMRQYSIKN